MNQPSNIAQANESCPVAKVWPVEFWSKHDVSVWLSSIDFKKYSQSFRHADICGRSLMLLEEAELRDIGVESLGDRKALCYEIRRLEKWKGFLWRTDLETGNGNEPITLELLMSLAPNEMSAICSVRNTASENEYPEVIVRWIFSQQQKVSETEDLIERFSTEAKYDSKQTRSIIRLPCPISEAEIQVRLANQPEQKSNVNDEDVLKE